MIAPMWNHEEGGGAFVRCGLCFLNCLVRRGRAGLCGVRTYLGHGFASPFLGKFSSVAIDPIEKKPLRRWRPGTRILSLGSVSCNMRCPFCQNHAIAQPDTPPPVRVISVPELAAMSRRSSLRAVAYTYNEPALQAEYIFSASPVLRGEGIATVMITNGMFSEAVCEEAILRVDAMNIDVKTFDEESYKRLGGSLDAVKSNVERLVAGGVHVELTNLVVPGVSDSFGDFMLMIDWICGVSREIPLHISRYFPAFRCDAPPTDLGLIGRFYEAARERLEYVYTGNVGLP
jgi:pyruvate formate lyase activating enzyme